MVYASYDFNIIPTTDNMILFLFFRLSWPSGGEEMREDKGPISMSRALQKLLTIEAFTACPQHPSIQRPLPLTGPQKPRCKHTDLHIKAYFLSVQYTT